MNASSTIPDTTVFVLIGAKGAGKSTLGRGLEAQFAVRFIHVEAHFLGLPESQRSTYDGYALVEAEVRSSSTPCSIELTGASPHVDRLLDSLREDRRLRLIRVSAPLQTCLARVRNRPGAHLPAEDELVAKVHAIAESLALPFDIHVDGSVEYSSSVLAEVAGLTTDR